MVTSFVELQQAAVCFAPDLIVISLSSPWHLTCVFAVEGLVSLLSSLSSACLLVLATLCLLSPSHQPRQLCHSPNAPLLSGCCLFHLCFQPIRPSCKSSPARFLSSYLRRGSLPVVRCLFVLSWAGHLACFRDLVIVSPACILISVCFILSSLSDSLAEPFPVPSATRASPCTGSFAHVCKASLTAVSLPLH